MKRVLLFSIFCFSAVCSEIVVTGQQPAVDQITRLDLNINGKGSAISLELYMGKSFYYPLMAVWIEDEAGSYIQTLYVPKSIATGIFKYGKQESGKWVSAPKRAPQTLPYWSHKRGIIASDGLYMPEPGNQVPDAYSGATPTQSFIISTKADNKLPDVFRILFEINQNWDWNRYWTNDKYPGDENYKMSCQPALVYETVIDTRKPQLEYHMKLIGHSHYSGKTGELFPDLSTFTTALKIADSIVVKVQ